VSEYRPHPPNVSQLQQDNWLPTSVQIVCSGLMSATEPWSGFYRIQPTMYAVAHTSQFTIPGKCKYLENAAVGVGRGGGWLDSMNSSSIVVFVCPKHVTAVIETMGAAAAVSTTLALVNVPQPLQSRTVHVWHTCENTSFVKQPDLTVSDSGSLAVTLPPKCLITLTTMDGGGPAPDHKIPPSAHMALNYSDDFEAYAVDTPVKYFADEAGSFAAAVVDGKKVFAQQVPEKPIHGAVSDTRMPTMLILCVRCMRFWCSSLLFFEHPHVSLYVFHMAHAFSGGMMASLGLCLEIHSSGKITPCQSRQPLAVQLHHRCGDETSQLFWTVLMVVTVSQVPGPPPPPLDTTGIAQLSAKSSSRGQCLDVMAQSSASGTKVFAWKCTGATNQDWTATGNTLRSLGKCATVMPDSDIEIFPCNGSALQRFTPEWPHIKHGNQCLGLGKASKAFPSNKLATVAACSAADLTQQWRNTTGGGPQIMPSPQFVRVCGRISNFKPDGSPPQGYCLIVDVDAKWYLAAGGKKGPAGRDLPLVLAHGALADAPQKAGGVHSLALTMVGSKISAAVDGKVVASLIDTVHTHGMAAVGSGELHRAFVAFVQPHQLTCIILY
jgi:hypothetical protein